MLTTIIFSAALLQAEPTSPSAETPPKPRSVVLILIDDMRYDAAHCLGHPFLETPHLDRLAAGGVSFERAFVTTALCSPSRATILTGQYMHRHKLFDNNTAFAPDARTFPQQLKEAGYQTGFFGKWHMGGSSDAPQPGFDRWVSFRGQGNYTSPDEKWTLNVDGSSVPQKGYITDELTDYALEWFDRLDSSKPFMMYLSHKAVHGPFEPAERHRGRYKDTEVKLPRVADDWMDRPGVPMWVKNQLNSWHGVQFPYHTKLDLEKYYREYCEAMLAVDDSVGRVMDALEKKGRLQDTLILFMGDNGFFWGEHGLIDKRCAYEESMRVPLLAHCPAMFTPTPVATPDVIGKRVKQIVANIDIAPTILACANVKPAGVVDGRSFLPLITADSPPADWRKEILYEYYWEWNFPQTPTMFAIRTETAKFIEYHGVWDTDELFDLEADPFEQANLVRDLVHQKQVHELRTRLHQLLEKSDGYTMPIGRKMGPGAGRRKEDGAKAAEFPPFLEK